VRAADIVATGCPSMVGPPTGRVATEDLERN
jgi:hypothetical protein